MKVCNHNMTVMELCQCDIVQLLMHANSMQLLVKCAISKLSFITCLRQAFMDAQLDKKMQMKSDSEMALVWAL